MWPDAFSTWYLAAVLLLIVRTTQAVKSQSTPNKYIDKNVAEGEAALTDEDFQRSRQRRQIEEIANEDEDFDDSAMYNRDKFEGDIVTLVNPKQNGENDETEDKPQGFVMRNAVKQNYLKWPNGRVPYTISTQYTSYGRARIAAAIQNFQEKTCIQFVPKTEQDHDYVHIVPEEGCYSMVGKVGGKQPVSIGNGCIQTGVIIHELTHSIGFFHEQSRNDRDSYIKIVWTNVESGLEDQFDKYDLSMIDHLGTKYDYGSVMHYGPTAFSKNGQATIEPLEGGVKIGQRVGFSANDLLKINKLYTCSEKLQTGTGDTLAQSGISISVTNLPDNSIQTGNKVNCVNLRDDCDFLAARGHCISAFGRMFMSVNCALTCGQCKLPSPSNLAVVVRCEDERAWCSSWASNGMCKVFLFNSYMQSRCSKSCKHC
ncbi:Metalloendopeptidase [Aphelenchoides besseyi]|nr:Metalloendopeptidase [Aphelenchoides besseyi]KAI6234955.1 Metalloendopeptidase [Aphelenchoides besseyi]